MTEIGKTAFVSALKAASGRAGGTAKLAPLIGHSQRVIQLWLKGQGPTYDTMQAVYAKLATIGSGGK